MSLARLAFPALLENAYYGFPIGALGFFVKLEAPKSQIFDPGGDILTSLRFFIRAGRPNLSRFLVGRISLSHLFASFIFLLLSIDIYGHRSHSLFLRNSSLIKEFSIFRPVIQII